MKGNRIYIIGVVALISSLLATGGNIQPLINEVPLWIASTTTTLFFLVLLDEVIPGRGIFA